MEERKQEKQEQSRQVYGGNVSMFAEVMEQVATLPTKQQEQLSFFIQGYVASSQAGRSRRAEVAV